MGLLAQERSSANAVAYWWQAPLPQATVTLLGAEALVLRGSAKLDPRATFASGQMRTRLTTHDPCPNRHERQHFPNRAHARRIHVCRPRVEQLSSVVDVRL